MENADIPKHKIRDLYGKFFYPFYKGRDGSRTPMQWNNTDFAGFSTTETYLPVNKNYKSINVETESKDENSIYSIYKKLITLRKRHIVLQSGEIEFLNKGNKNVLIYSRYLGNKKITILLNFGFSRKKIKNTEVLTVLFSTHKKNITEIEGTVFLEAYEGLVLESKKPSTSPARTL
jgi:alpha-glucosidase